VHNVDHKNVPVFIGVSSVLIQRKKGNMSASQYCESLAVGENDR